MWIRCVQPAIPQHIKMNPSSFSQQWTQLMTLSRSAPQLHRTPTHIVWPETAIPWIMTSAVMSSIRLQTPAHMFMGGDFIDDHGLHVGLVGSSPTGSLVPLYAKEHLVPGGEYIPLRSLLQRWLPSHWLRSLTGKGTDFSPGKDQPRALPWPDTPPFRCLICYEGIFPGTIKAPDGTLPPQWILAISNDAWYSSWGQWQHFHNTRYRALEEGLPLVRVCNTGVTAIIDPFGQVIQQLAPNQPGVLDGPLPSPLKQPPSQRSPS
jgi:apolipoprotein N-acyltransferase